jgi:hypothetical protein
MRRVIARRILTWTAVTLIMGQLGCAARAVAPSATAPPGLTGEVDRPACEGYADRHPTKSVLARTLLGGLVLLPLGAGVAVLGLAVGRPDGLVLPFMAFNPAIDAARENRITRERALATCLDPIIQAQTLGPRHPDVARSLVRLADDLALIGELAQAEELYQRALAIQQDALGADHGDVARTLDAYAALLRKSGRMAEAVELELRIVTIRTKAASVDENRTANGGSAASVASESTGAEALLPSTSTPTE